MKLLVFAFSLFFFINSNEVDQQTYIIKKGYTVALSKQSFDKMMDAISNKDNEYFLELQRNKEILTLPGDVEAYLVESHSFSGYSIMRLKGKDVKFWTINESIKRD